MTNQQKAEKKWANIFINFLKFKYGLNYYLKPCNKRINNMCDIDVIAVNNENNEDKLYLQLTRDMREDKEDGYPFFDCNNIVKAMSDKVNKYKKQNKQMKEVILLIQGDMDKQESKYEFTKDIINYAQNTPFKGVYYLSPVSWGGKEGVFNKKEMFVKVLKDCFSK